MRISWRRVGMMVGVVVVLVAGGQTSATKPYKQSVVKCSPGICAPDKSCATPAAPKVCGETKDGPYFVATIYCCCCTEGWRDRWFFGE